MLTARRPSRFPKFHEEPRFGVIREFGRAEMSCRSFGGPRDLSNQTIHRISIAMAVSFCHSSEANSRIASGEQVTAAELFVSRLVAGSES
jgi:hypothetical protein